MADAINLPPPEKSAGTPAPAPSPVATSPAGPLAARAATAPPGPPKVTRRGRPPGAKDKAPRRPVGASTGAPGPTPAPSSSPPSSPSSGPQTPGASSTPPPSPFSGAVAGDGPGQQGQAIPTAATLAALPAEDLAALALGVGEAIALTVARGRYGDEIAEAIVPLSKDEKKMLEPLTATWIKENAPALTTGEALVLMLVITTGQRVAIMEKMRSDRTPKDKAA